MIVKRIPTGPSAAYDADHDLLEWLQEQFKQHGDIYRASIYGTNVYVINSLEYVEHVLLKNWQNYVKGQAIKRIALLLGKGLMVSEGDFWVNQRRMIQPAFRREAISALLGIIEEGNRSLLASWRQAAKDRTPINVTRDLSSTILRIVLRAIFGDDFRVAASHFNILSERPERSLAFADAFRPLAGFITKLAAERRAANIAHHDLLGMLMHARDRETGCAMPDRQLSQEIMTLIVAGHETTASVLNWTWYLLSQHPGAEQRLALELDELLGDELPELDGLPKFAYTRRIIEEAMRLYPPGWLLTRKALSDDHLGDFFVPTGTEIYIAPYLIQRHPRLWDEPDRFNPDRFDGESSPPRHPLAMMPFSVGPRNCIGEFLARMEMQIHLMIIARHLRLRLVEPQRPQLAAGVNLLSRQDFVMTAELRT